MKVRLLHKEVISPDSELYCSDEIRKEIDQQRWEIINEILRFVIVNYFVEVETSVCQAAMKRKTDRFQREKNFCYFSLLWKKPSVIPIYLAVKVKYQKLLRNNRLQEGWSFPSCIQLSVWRQSFQSARSQMLSVGQVKINFKQVK